MINGVPKSTYYDKVLGGWVGKCAGGILGAPIEGYKVFNEIELTDELFANNFANDDLDLQVLWLDMMAKKGRWVREEDFARHWTEHVAFPWNEYGIATRNLKLGLDIPDSGRHNNWYWRESMGSPIRSEIWGMLFPGDPAAAARYARMDSELDHEGFSVEAEMLLSACAALAFVEDEPRRLLERGLEQVPADGSCAAMVARVTGWYDNYGFETAAAKIKSYYGDADFTAAPMNVGFTILAILNAGRDFDGIVRALHLGHDSDCIVATAGALVGIVSGFEAIPESWRRRVGNELLISPEIVGIDCPDTLTGLAEWTCATGMALATDASTPPRPFALRSELVGYHGPLRPRLKITLENLTDAALELDLGLESAYCTADRQTINLAARATTTAELDLKWKAPTPVPQRPTYDYTLTVDAAGTTHRFPKGIPYYGEWLLAGPFITADASLVAMDPDYPDHGMSSLPSVRYMNHDRSNGPETDFLDPAAVRELLASEHREASPYGVALVRPGSMSVDLGDYFHGRGERTLYLITTIERAEESRQWLCLGSTARLSARLNGETVLAADVAPLRRWPATRVAELPLKAGTNVLTIRLDTITDDYRLDVGLKDLLGKHHHQSHWNTDIVFSIPH